MDTVESGGNLERLIDELARVLCEAGNARELVLRAGFEAAQVPVFDTPGVFWSRVARAAEGGRTVGGVPPFHADHDTDRTTRWARARVLAHPSGMALRAVTVR